MAFLGTSLWWFPSDHVELATEEQLSRILWFFDGRCDLASRPELPQCTCNKCLNFFLVLAAIENQNSCIGSNKLIENTCFPTACLSKLRSLRKHFLWYFRNLFQYRASWRFHYLRVYSCWEFVDLLINVLCCLLQWLMKYFDLLCFISLFFCLNCFLSYVISAFIWWFV